ncbi:uncharacterized protein [Lolium perenne]|uniref:uncharacterized protein isoform X3 n=1 Tax=Lolium perenne TaxID=4522 RepID=UPI0021F59D3F|nr:uncharacterized protein LOC127306885 isoform X3 [Lolium perenne]
MDALMASYASGSDDDEPAPVTGAAPDQEASAALPPPPLDLLHPPNFIDYSALAQGNRVRSFPHVEGIYALHVYIPELCKDEQKLEKVLLGREFHVSLGRTVGIQVDQIDSLVAMLRQKFQSQQRYWMDFNKWEHFVNDDSTRSFLSLEVTRTGLPEISRQIHMVDEVYRLHGLPEFYKNPRPHISLVWALGDVSSKLKHATKEIEKFQNTISSSKNCNLRCNFSRVVCKVGKKVYDICKIAD